MQMSRWVLRVCLCLMTLTGSACFLPVTRGDPQSNVKSRAQNPGSDSAPKPIRFTQNVAGDTRPLQLDADQISTWVENRQRVILLRGQGLIQQGALQVRAQQAALFVDLDKRRRDGIYSALIYAVGKVRYDDPGATRVSEIALGVVSTRGEILLRSHRQTVGQKNESNDPLYQRGKVAVAPLVPKEKPKVKPKLPSIAPLPLPPVPGSSESSEAPKTDLRSSGASLLPPAPAPLPSLPTTPLPKPKGKVSPQPIKPTQFTPESVPPPPGGGSASIGTEGTGSIGNVTPIGPGPRPNATPGRRVQATPNLRYTLAPRIGSKFKTQSAEVDGEQVTVVTEGVVVQVSGLVGIETLDIEADNAVIWSTGNPAGDLLGTRAPSNNKKEKRRLELYLSGRVEIRQKVDGNLQTLRADEIYYDVNRNSAFAVNADLEMDRPGLLYPLHVKAGELRQLSKTKFEVIDATISSSKLPSDPGLRVLLGEATVEETSKPMTSIFGKQVIDRKTGQPIIVKELLTVGRNATVKLEGVPIFYTPFFQGDARDPLGPIQSIRFGFNQIYGAQFGVSLNVYDLFGIQPYQNTRWNLDLDYLADRGPAIGTEFDYSSRTFFEHPAIVQGRVLAWGILDDGIDQLGRPPTFDTPNERGRFRWLQNVQELPDGFSIQSQVAWLSDRNVYEQFYKLDFDHDINQTTFLYIKQQKGTFAWTALGEPRLRDWVTMTEWLPRADAYLLGQSFLDLFTYHLEASAGYAQMAVSNDPFPPVSPTDQVSSTMRFDVFQEISMPLRAGPFKIVPYGIFDITYYTENLNGEDTARVYGGAGVRSSIPFSRLYQDVSSVLFNFDGLNHKIELTSDYFIAESNESFSQFAQLDRLNDDATDRALREFTPVQPLFNPGAGAALAFSPLYDPQLFAIRRGLQNHIDTRDGIHVLRLNANQRLQTKRGFPGRKHIVDWMKFDVSTSLFPAMDRDNFGELWAFLEYDFEWNVGDRTSLVSSGWFDPFSQGARVYNFGVRSSRPDNTQFYLGYRQVDPLQSRAVIASLQYIFSPKYAVSFSTVYDFGIAENLSTSVLLTRMGTDVQVSVGINYNALINNFGIVFQILPNLVLAQQSRRNSRFSYTDPSGVGPISPGGGTSIFGP